MPRSLFAALNRLSGTSPTRERLASTADEAQTKFLNVFPVDVWLKPRKGEPRKSVAVIGGGFAGLAAAAALVKDFDVTVFEASHKLGGRVRTCAGIEEGGELIGSNHPAWGFFAKHFRFDLTPLTEENEYAGRGWEIPLRLLDRQISKGERDMLIPQVEHLCRTLGERAEAVFRLPSMAYAPWMQTNNDSSLEDWLNEFVSTHPPSELSRSLFNFEFENHYGACPCLQSLFAILVQIRGGGLFVARESKENLPPYFEFTENYRCSAGNAALAEKLREHVIESSRDTGSVRTSTPVKRVSSQGHRVEITTKETECKKSECLEFNFAIVAVPWTLLSGNDPLDISNWDCPSIQSGTTVKYISEVRGPFWEDIEKAPSGISSACGQTWDGTAENTPETLRALNLFAGGSVASEAIQRNRAKEVDEFYSVALNKLYPGYSKARISGKFVDWPNERNVKCGYCCPRPGDLARLKSFIPKHRDGLAPKGIYFAGEHTCPPFFGYMEGALQSGCIAAADIRGYKWRRRLNEVCK